MAYSGPVQITYENRGSFTGAIILGDTVLLGAIAMEDMDLVVSPRDQKLTVNPASPNIPSAVVMQSKAEDVRSVPHLTGAANDIFVGG